jgi:asparaginyl-tRNA synthetase
LGSSGHIFKGWVYKHRVLGKKIFIDLRPMNEGYIGEILQVVAARDKLGEDEFKKFKEVTQESFIIVEGNLVEEPRAPGGVELHATRLIELRKAEQPYPLAKKEHSPDFLLDNRHLVVRSPRYTKIWMIREKLIQGLREWYKRDGWFEVHTPIIQFTAVEGGATLFPVKYFDQTAYLSQSAQLYLEVLIFSLGKVFSLTPSFRAEKSRTRRHLAEYWHFEAEAANYDFDDILKAEEEPLKYAIDRLLEDEKISNWIKEFRGTLDDLEDLKTPFPRITYTEAIEILQGKGVKIRWGEDLGADEEKILSGEFETPFFVTLYPTRIKAFYVKSVEGNEDICYSADMMAPNYGEITTGGRREDDINVLIERIKREGFEPELYFWYLDLRRYGSVPHSGFGLGIERVLQWLLNIDHIREVIPFPRLARRKSLI